jgi:hypothetical protein
MSIVLIPVALWSAWDYYEARRIRRIVGEIRQKGERLATVKVATTEDPGNAGRYYIAAAALVNRAPLYTATGINAAFSHGRDGRQAAIARARDWLREQAEAERLLSVGTDLPFLGLPPGTDSSLRWDRLSGLNALASFRLKERLDAGDAEGAAAALVAQLGVARSLKQWSSWPGEPIASSVVGSLADLGGTLGAGPHEAALSRLQQAITEHDLDDAVDQMALNARAYLIEQVWNEGQGWYARPPVRFGPSPLEPLLFLIVRPWLAHQVNAELRTLTTAVEQARRPWPARLSTPGSFTPPNISGRLSVLTFQRSPLGAISYLHKRQVDATGVALAHVRTGTAAVAVARFRLAHGGSLPSSLDELVPALLPRVPVDPFSGSAIKYARRDGEFIVYSVGPNGKDDGGATHRRVEGPPGYQRVEATPDLGVRVQVNDNRRLE